jgi:hypothetical protein
LCIKRLGSEDSQNPSRIGEVGLAPTREGGFIARKVIPFDVRHAYAELYGQRTEERLNTGPMPVLLARAKHREWSSEMEARFANIRAERSGAGRTLTPKEARALAGEWYGWFTTRMAARNWPTGVWEDYEAHMRSELYGPAMAGGVFAGDYEGLSAVSGVHPIWTDSRAVDLFLCPGTDTAPVQEAIVRLGRDGHAVPKIQ